MFPNGRNKGNRYNNNKRKNKRPRNTNNEFQISRSEESQGSETIIGTYVFF